MPPFRHGTLAPASGVNALVSSIGRIGAAPAAAAHASATRTRTHTGVNRRRLDKALSIPQDGAGGRGWRRRVSRISLTRVLTSRVVRLRHRAVVESLVENVFLDALLPRHLAERASARGGLLHDLGRPVVADVR